LPENMSKLLGHSTNYRYGQLDDEASKDRYVLKK
jgi:hypothetical protein